MLKLFLKKWVPDTISVFLKLKLKMGINALFHCNGILRLQIDYVPYPFKWVPQQ